MKRTFIPLLIAFLVTAACGTPTQALATIPLHLETKTFSPAPGEPSVTAISGTPAPVSSGLPDLAVGQYASVIYFGCPWTEGGEIRGTVKNAGTGRASAFEVQINDGKANISGLESGMSAYPAVSFAKGPVGHIDVVADPNNQVQESDKGNNAYHIVFTPPPPCRTITPSGNGIAPNSTPVPPLTYTVQANQLWNQPDVLIRRGDTVHIRYRSGTWTYSATVPPFDGRGNVQEPICGLVKPGAQCNEVLPLARTGALLAAMPLSDYIAVGQEVTFTAATGGYVNLVMNAAVDQSAVAQRQGQINVEITIIRK